LVIALLPLAGAILMGIFVGQFSFSGVATKAVLLFGIAIIAATAGLIAVDASTLKMGPLSIPKESGPLTWAIGVFFLWIVGFPLYLYKRSKHGALNLAGVGILSMIVFLFTSSSVILTAQLADSAVAGMSSMFEGLAIEAPATAMEQTKTNMRTITITIFSYSIDHERFPNADTIVDLAVRLEPKYIARLPYKDGWDNTFVINSSESKYELRSLGPDGIRSHDDIVNIDGMFSDGSY